MADTPIWVVIMNKYMVLDDTHEYEPNLSRFQCARAAFCYENVSDNMSKPHLGLSSMHGQIIKY